MFVIISAAKARPDKWFAHPAIYASAELAGVALDALRAANPREEWKLRELKPVANWS